MGPRLFCAKNLRRLPCAAFGCGSSRVAASGGQGGIGGLRVPPTPSLDSLLTPLYRRRSAEGLDAAGRGVIARRSAVGARGWCVGLRSIVALRLSRRRSAVGAGVWGIAAVYICHMLFRRVFVIFAHACSMRNTVPPVAVLSAGVEAFGGTELVLGNVAKASLCVIDRKR